MNVFTKDGEIWEPLVYYMKGEKYIVNDYLISNHGNVYSKITNMLLSTKSRVAGYPAVSIILRKGQFKQFLVHRLVGFAFIPNPENKRYINHIDTNRENCHVSNLEWTSPRGNAFHRRRMEDLNNGKSVNEILKDSELTNNLDVIKERLLSHIDCNTDEIMMVIEINADGKIYRFRD